MRVKRRRRPPGRFPGQLVTGAGLALAVRELLRRRNAIDLHGQVVLITGGSRGLGLLLAEQFAHAGAKIAICAREVEELDEARRKLALLTQNVLAVSCDVTRQDQVQQLVDQVITQFGRIDVLVNNAGIITVGPADTQTLADFETSMQVMFWGVLYATLAVLPGMRERKSGRIVNVTSIGGKVSVPHLLPYSCAKFAAVGLSEGLGAELRKDGVAVVTVVPGLMRTGSHINARFKGRNKGEYTWFSLAASLPFTAMDATRAARQIVAATCRGDPEVILSPQAKALAWVHGIAPGLTVDLLSIVNRLLPGSGGVGTESRTGTDSQTRLTRRLLETLHQFSPHGDNER